MAKKKETKSGLTSAAGLMRYYEADKSAIAINPKTVLVVSVIAAVIIVALNAYYGMWP
ncbi:MAG: preprotein translocase subunit Sec61beta [Methanocellales archaeon]|nr:preprotein translocase subunit Sec61beta [Methanocellales archaeon]